MSDVSDQDATRMSRVSDDSPSSLPHAYLIGRPAVCCGGLSAARLSVCYEETAPVEFKL